MVDRLDRGLGKLPDRATSEEVHSHKEALATAIRQARPNAKQGDVFAAADRDRLVRIVREATSGPAGAAARSAIAEDNPKAAGAAARVALAPNAAYPEGAPVSTIPPALLLRLPPLPDTVDYRFIGKALVLRDTRAGIIVDYIPNALP